MHPERKRPSESAETATGLHIESTAADHGRRGKPSRIGIGPYVSCNVGQGPPTVNGRVWSYYVSQQDGRQMLVVNRRTGERIRLNNAIEIVILEVDNGRVQIGVATPPDDDKEGKVMPTDPGNAAEQRSTKSTGKPR